jgi:NSS family neurotransmitter:Na+ symporter
MAWALNYAVSSITVAWGLGLSGAEAAGGYFFETVLGLSSGPAVLGGLQWPIVGALAVTWIIIFLVMFRGACVIGKVSQWAVCIAWVFLAVLVLRGITLAGSAQGLNFYLAPNFAGLANIDVWYAAFSQIAFTLSLGMAGMFAYGSFIAKKADVNNNAVVTSIADASTAFFAGFAIFSTVGYMMQAMSVPVEDVASASIGLAFVGFPAAISMLPALNAFTGVIFFLCLFFLGLTSAYFLAYGAVVTPLTDKFGWSRTKTSLIVCIVCFVIGLIYTAGGGLYWLDMVDRLACFYLLLITGALACIVVGWVFGAEKLRQHVNETSDFKIGAWWDWLIKIVVPAALLFVVIYGGFVQDIATPYGGYGNWSLSIWILLIVTLGVSFWLQAAKTRTPKGGE